MSTPAEPSSLSGAARWFAPGLAAITLIGLIGRFAYLIRSKVDNTPTIYQGDAFWYSTTAQNLAKGKLFLNLFTGNPTADHPPLTVVILGPASFLFRNSTYAQRVTMVLLGAATVAVIGLAGRHLAGPRAGLIAATIAASAPALWVNDVLVMSETLTALLVALVLWAGIALAERQTTRLALLAGGLCGLAALTRAETGLFLPLMVWPILAMARNLDWRRRWQLLALATAATAAVMMPWTALNFSRFQEPVAISNNDGLTLIGANCATTYHGGLIGGWVIDPCITDLYASIDDKKPALTDAQRAAQRAADRAKTPTPLCDDPNQKRLPCWDSSKVSKLMRSEGLRYITGHTRDLPRVVLARNGRVWGFYRFDQAVGTGAFEGRMPWVSRWGFYLTWTLLPASAAGGYILHRRKVSLAPFIASLFIVVSVTTAFYGLVRFRLPYDVASSLLAGVAISALLDHRQKYKSPEPS